MPLRRCCCALPFVLLCVVPTAAYGQAGTALRTGLGTSLGIGSDGAPRYREDSGWNSANFSQPTWAVEYGAALNGGSPWTSVLQAGRTNAGFTAADNKLTFDLGGSTYSVKQFASGGVAVGGKVLVVDRNSTGASLKITNGTFANDGGTGHQTEIGATGKAGRLTVDGATLQTRDLLVGSGTGANGSLTVNTAGTVTVSNRMTVGSSGTGSVSLSGANASVSASEIILGSFGTGSIALSGSGATLRASTASGGVGDLTVTNPAGSGVALQVDAGTLRVDHDLRLAPNGSIQQGSMVIDGGTVTVGRNVTLGQSTSATTGGKVFLNSGRFEVSTPGSVTFSPPAGAGAGTQQFYWKAGTLAFSSAGASLTDAQLKSFTTQGAATYGGDRAAGKVATGQVIDAAGTLTLSSGTIGLSGGTIAAAGGLVVNNGVTVSGYGTIDAVVSGTGTITQSGGATALAIGALGGANAVTGNSVQVGHLGVNATHTGTISSGGIVTKVGAGTQTFQGAVTANDGVNVNAGKLVFSGNTLNTSPLRVSAGATARFQSGATGTVSSVTTNAATATADGGRLQIDGATTKVTAGAVTNNGWIELTNGGTLTVGSVQNPGQLVNNGQLINGGTLNATVTGAGTISGSGTFAAAVTIASGATLSPGNSPGTATFTDLTLGSGGNFELELANATGTAGTNWDLAAVGNLLSVTATSLDPFTIVLKSLTGAFAPGALAGFDPTQAYSWKFASVTDPSKLTGFDTSKFEIDATDFVAYNGLAGGTFGVSSANDGLYVTFSAQGAAVPEPGSLTLLGLAGAAAGGWAARRRRRQARGTG